MLLQERFASFIIPTSLLLGLVLAEGELCEQLDISDALVLTTNTVPQDYTCFNVAEIFSQSKDTGFQNDTAGVKSPDPYDPVPRGVHWELRNRDTYDPDANYSPIWHEQVNSTGKIKPGKAAPWILWTYAFEDCKQIAGDGSSTEEDENPWFASSCQTEEGGECHVVPDPIRSFGIAEIHFKCQTWAFKGDAAKEQRGMSLLESVTAGVLIYLLI